VLVLAAAWRLVLRLRKLGGLLPITQSAMAQKTSQLISLNLNAWRSEKTAEPHFDALGDR
jgi:hypothetical protein